MKNRIIAFAVSVLLLITALPITASAASEAKLVAESYTATQGGYAYIYLRADNFVDIAVLDIEVFYDTSVMSVTSTSNGTMLSGASVSTNTAEAGVIRISAMTVKGFNSGTSSYSNRMMTLRFKVNADAPAGAYPVRVSIGNAYDSSFAPAAISGVDGTVTVKAAALSAFSLSISKSTTAALTQGSVFTLNVNHSSSSVFSSADLHVEYDREHLKIGSVTLSSALTGEGMVHSINTSNPGLAVISFASQNAVSTYNILSVSFEVTADADASTVIRISASDVYRDELTPYAPYSISTSMKLAKKQMLPDCPDMRAEVGRVLLGEQTTARVILEGGAAVAAGDFILNYDTEQFRVTGAEASADALAFGALIIINPALDSGEIRFSYVNQTGGFAEDTALVEITLVPLTADRHYSLNVSGADVVDLDYESVTLDYPTAGGCIYSQGELAAPTETDEGSCVYACSCGSEAVFRIGALGDIDADGSVTSYDISVMVRALSGWNTEEHTAPKDDHMYPDRFFDINGDGHFNNRDVIMLIKAAA